MRNPSLSLIVNQEWGLATDKIVPADYDGNGKTDMTVYRNGNWYLQQSTAGFRAVQWGMPGNVPIHSAFLP